MNKIPPFLQHMIRTIRKDQDPANLHYSSFCHLNEWANDLTDRERQWQNDVKSFLIDTLRKHAGRISFAPKNARDEYPVTATLYGQHDFPRIDISTVYLNDEGEYIMADGFEVEEESQKIRCGFSIEPEQLSDIFYFVKNVLNL